MICFLKASESPGHNYSLGFDRSRFENRSMNIARKEDLFAPGVLPYIAES